LTGTSTVYTIVDNFLGRFYAAPLTLNEASGGIIVKQRRIEISFSEFRSGINEEIGRLM